MGQIEIFFEAELSFFLPVSQHNQWFVCEFSGTPSLKHLIESLGVPHTEVGIVFADAKPVDLNQLVRDTTRIWVGANRADRLPEQLVEPHFILDNHLGKLARYLRLLGFNAVYQYDLADDALARIAFLEKRILLTRDRRLLMRKIVDFGYCLRSLDPQEQVMEILDRYQLKKMVKPFNRCLLCNQELARVEKSSIIDRLEPLTIMYFDEFKICNQCGQIYWKGSHYDRIVHKITAWMQDTEAVRDNLTLKDS